MQAARGLTFSHVIQCYPYLQPRNHVSWLPSSCLQIVFRLLELTATKHSITTEDKSIEIGHQPRHTQCPHGIQEAANLCRSAMQMPMLLHSVVASLCTVQETSLVKCLAGDDQLLYRQDKEKSRSGKVSSGDSSAARCESCTWSLKRQALSPNRATISFSILALNRIWHAFLVHGQSARIAAKAFRPDGKLGPVSGWTVGKMHPLLIQKKVSA